MDNVKDPVALAIDAFERIKNKAANADRLTAFKAIATFAENTIAALSSIKDQQAQPVEQQFGSCIHGVYGGGCTKCYTQAPVDQQAHGAMPDLAELRRAICGMSCDEDFEGFGLVRRNRVLTLIDQRIDAAPQAPASLPEVWWDRGAGSFYLNRDHIPAHIQADRITALCRCDTKETAQEQGRDHGRG